MDAGLRETIREAVLDVLREEREHPAYHPRAPFVRHVDPDGKTWLSATASKAQAITAILGLLAAVFGGIWGSMAVRDSIVIMPQVAESIEARLADHERHVREAMEAVRPTIATKAEVAELSEQLAVSRAERITQYTAIQAQLARIEARLERLGR